jgi:DNA-binding SARP family transcriptional activator/tetratricopeptide (TPR) repeat protein
MAPMPGPPQLDHRVDTALEPSVSFARPETNLDLRHHAERQPIPVGPGRPPLTAPSGSGPLRDEVTGYQIQLAKVQPPVLRDETLERPRLLDWLRAKIHGRVVLLLADAGYGKTTLLADFARRHRLRTLWYRLDDDDRDWVTLLRHLVASGQEHDPEFAPRTRALLTETGIGGPGRDEVLGTFLDELPAIAVNGAMLILDDFHLVDDAVDARFVARELLARAPERFTIVVASRRLPTVPLAKLRSVGEVAELRTDDLRFDVSETTLLFNETFGRRLEQDVLVDLAHRTEGWIASLQLVNAALRDRTPSEIRRFVRGLTGADHELYDYLAEEVVGDLADELQRFLMETAILQVVTPELAEVVTDRDAAAVTRLTATAERLTLLSRMSGSPRTHRRYHPLVREFLEARLRTMDGPDAVADLHRRTAVAAAAFDWRIAAYHYREAGDIEAMLDVVGDAIPSIMGNGQYALAEAFIGGLSADLRPARFDLILSRVDMQQGDYQGAIDASLAVLDSGDSDPVQRDHALLNLVTLYLNYGDGDRAMAYAERLRDDASNRDIGSIAKAVILTLEAAYDGDLDIYQRQLFGMGKAQRPSSQHHYAVTMLNVSLVAAHQDDPERSIRYAEESLRAFESTSSRMESSSAISSRAVALARLGHLEVATRLVASAAEENPDPDLLIESAEFQDAYGSASEYEIAVDWASRLPNLTVAHQRNLALVRARHLTRLGQADQAKRLLDGLPPGRWTGLCFEVQRLVTAAHAEISSDGPTADRLVGLASSLAERQKAHYWYRSASLLSAIRGSAAHLSSVVTVMGERTPWHLTEFVDLLLPRTPELDGAASAAVLHAATMYPLRWRDALRSFLHQGDRDAPSRLMAARTLEAIGERTDIPLLRSISREMRKVSGSSTLGRNLIRRVADRVYVEDQGRVSVRIGDRYIDGSNIRRKVLALVCFLLTRPQMSATRDQVLDAIWPDLDPEVAVNSLNQTLYFLRRVFETAYVEDYSPGYVHHDSDVIWLDANLVTSRSIEARSLIRAMGRNPSPADIEALVDVYVGRFALDFEYEEWASPYRDSLHAAYLELVERAVRDDAQDGHHERGIRVARRVLEVDPSAESIEASLLRLYRLVQAHAAAAEQYAHYSTMMRDELGIEPPPLDSL